MSRLEELQAVVDSPSGILADAEIAEYVTLCDRRTRDLHAATSAEARRQSEATTELKRVAALHGRDLIVHAIRSGKIKAT